jgi:O-antigen/teichoic acid export membrane protein
LISGSGLSGALALLVSVVPSWFLSSADYGLFSQYYTTIGFSVLLFGAGLNISFTYYVANKKIAYHQLKTVLLFVDILAFFICILLTVVNYIFGFISSYLIAAIYTGALGVRLVNLSSIFLGLSEYHKHNIALILRFLVPLIVLFLVQIYTNLSIDIVVYAVFIPSFAFIYVISIGLTLYQTKTNIKDEQSFSLKNFFYYGVKALFSNLTYMIGQRGFVYIIGAVLSVEHAGVYFIFLALLEALLIVPAAIGKWYLSKTNEHDFKKKDFIFCFMIIFFVVIVMCLIILIVDYFSITLMSSAKVQQELIQLFYKAIPLIFIMGFLKILSQVNCGKGFVSLTLYGSIFSALSTVFFGGVLVSKFGIDGAVLSLTLGASVNLLINSIPFIIKFKEVSSL